MADSFSFAGSVSELTTSVDDLNRRLEIYSDQLFRQARWEAQLFQSELLGELSSGESIPFAAKLMKSTEQVADFMNRVEPPLDRALIALEDLPKVIDSGREAAVNAFHDEFAQTFQVVREERVAALAQLTAERVAALNDFGDDLVVERRAMTHDIDQISQSMVDHAMWRLAQLAAAMIAVMFLAAVALLLGVRRMFFQYGAK
jgi:ATP-dependent protease HslVU (ClpYQ) peptidase subunit